VAVPLPVRALFTYQVPAGMTGCVLPGARAVVPVGRRIVTGVIAGASDGAGLAPDRIRDVKELPDAAPVLPADLLRVALWAARYYVTAPGGMIAAALPPGSSRRSVSMVSLIPPGPDSPSLTPADRRALASLPADTAVDARRLSLAPAVLKRLEAAGSIRIDSVLEGPRVKEKQTRVLHLAAPGAPDLERALQGASRAPRQQALLRLLVETGGEGMAIEEVYDRLGRIPRAVQALVSRGMIRVTRHDVWRSPHLPALPVGPGGTGGAAPILSPNAEQAAAIETLTTALTEGKGGAFLMMGVTGSGKTEVYLRAIERCLAGGRDALYLVPEITLTPLLARNLRARLGADLAILHSSLGRGERFDEWRRVRSGGARIVLGARSAVMAPLSRLGLIVVDEEQDASYKQEEEPRYNARDLALLRGKESGAAVILGSATPSIESFHAAQSGRYGLLRLTSRIHARPMATVRVVDMREEFARTGRDDVVSSPLREAVAERLARGEQAIILLNRRGYAPFALCRSCGAVETCKRCSVALTYHRAENRMRCHYCGYQKGRSTACATCRSDKIVLTGTGTEKLEEQVRELFPGARLARLDRDTARGRRAPAEILSAFEKGEFNLLVGTQMVAKGHDFPGVTIVGVIGADNALAMPDFRAAERTFQILTQVAGRSGRGVEPGEVIVQAFHRDHYAIEAASRQDYAAFYEKESRFRKIMKYPPFAVMAHLIVQASSPEQGVKRARLVGEVVRSSVSGAMEVIGPSVAPLARLKGRYRYQLLVKAPSRRGLSDALNEAAAALAGHGLSSARDLIIDMDPVTLI